MPCLERVLAMIRKLIVKNESHYYVTLVHDDFVDFGLVYYGDYFFYDLIGHNLTACIWMIPGFEH
jgi:hypothetical protein